VYSKGKVGAICAIIHLFKNIGSLCCSVIIRNGCTDRDVVGWGGVTQAGAENHVLDGDQGWKNPFSAARGDKMAMRPIIKIL